MENSIQILYIDDDPINLELFRINFSRKFEVFTGLSGDEGLQLLEDHRQICIIISDMKMPGMNGIEFIREASKLSGPRGYFLLTGYGMNDQISDALDEGLINGYFSKPIQVDSIERSIIRTFHEISDHS